MVTSYRPPWAICVLFSFLLFACFLPTSHADHGGCEGTVTAAPELSKLSKSKIDFTVVKIKLITRDGVLKETTECAPTGYYFLPTYDKGSFFLEIEGPAGWNFEPKRVPVTISDDSRCGDDINFKFTGFSLRGKVIGAAGAGSGDNNNKGPQGVTVTLHVEGKPVATAVSSDTGSYVFHNVYPGTHEVTASHSHWQISPAKITAQMEWNNLQVDTPFVVTGYSARGRVLSGEEAVPGVDFYLYSASVTSGAGCTAPPAQVPPAAVTAGKQHGKLLCVAQSDAKGEFRFDSVPTGDYTLVPVYHSAHTTYDVAPASAALHVEYGDAVLETPFRVVGFGVSGRVVADGKGIEGARVLVNGAEKAVTAKDGSYRLEQFKAGTYDFTAEKQQYVFAKLKNERITANIARIPDISATEVSVCGTLSIVQPPPNVKLGVREVRAKPEGSTNAKQQSTQADKDGKYCFSLAPGSYTIAPTVSASEEKAGLNFSPSSATIDVASTPIEDVNFSQLRVTVSGRVVCLTTPCDPAVSVTLLPTSTATPSSSSVTTTSLDITDNQFFLRDVLPGNYRVVVNIPNDIWCWVAQSVDLNINRDITNLEFVQNGFALPVTTSHDVDLRVAHTKDKKEEVHSLSAAAAAAAGGSTSNRICLKTPGTYTLTPKSCFKFGQDSFSFDTSAPKPIDLKATHMLVEGSVRSSEKLPAVQIAISDVAQGAVVANASTQYDSQQQAYTFHYWALPAAKLKFTPVAPQSPDLLSYPPSREYNTPDSATNCLPALPSFELRKGLFLRGKVTPPIAGVRIVVRGGSDEVLASVETGADGAYSVGPLYEDAQYTVSAEKEDFHFQKDDAGLNFRAAKLGRLRVRVEDANGEGVAGVLLSLSGEGGYRNNSATQPSGELAFSDLFPGSYFVRAHLKEYTFQPASASVEVKEGEEAVVRMQVKRVAFSCFGKVKGLNAFPEKGVTVVAKPTDSSSTAAVEETQTDNAGNYRIRGLVPTVTYSIFVKPSAGAVDIAIPESFTLLMGKEDTHNIDFVVIRKMQFFDIIGTVNSSREHLNTLTANIYASNSPDTPLRSIPLGVTSTFLFDEIPVKSEAPEYIIRLSTTLSSRAYDITITPDEIVVDPKAVAGSPRTGPVSFRFDATLKHEVAEVPVQGISSFFILLVLPIVLFRYRETVLPVAKSFYNQYVVPLRNKGSSFQQTTSGGSGSSVRKQRPTKESSQNEFDFLPPGLSSFSKTKQKTKTK